MPAVSGMLSRPVKGASVPPGLSDLRISECLQFVVSLYNPTKRAKVPTQDRRAFQLLWSLVLQVWLGRSCCQCNKCAPCSVPDAGNRQCESEQTAALKAILSKPIPIICFREPAVPHEFCPSFPGAGPDLMI